MICLWTRKLQEELNKTGSSIICIYLHPGVVYTGMSFRNLLSVHYANRASESAENASKLFAWPVGRTLLAISRLTFMSVVDGSRTTEFAAAAPEVRKNAEKYRGQFLVPIAKLSAPSKEALDDELGLELWNTTERFMKEWDLL